MAVATAHQWHALSVPEVLRAVNAGPEGLSEDEAGRRREVSGPNEISLEERNPIVRIVLRQFTGPLILILAGAGILSLILHSPVDAAIIAGVILINAIVGFVQEYKVSAILAQLRSRLEVKATVLRGGKPRLIDARQLVPGDILLLQHGDRIPADARIIAATELRTNEAVLTGESMPAEKSARPVPERMPVADRTDMVYSGTFVEEGTARAVVVETGPRTQFGTIAVLIVRERGHDVTPLQTRLGALARSLARIFVGLAALTVILGIATGRDPLTMFLTAVAIAVAAVPESLPVAVSVVLAIGARRILAKGGLVRKMAAAETLGSVTVIATDKTATLTEGRMAVDRVILADGREVPGEKFNEDLERLVLTSNAFVQEPSDGRTEEQIVGRPIERALLRAALDAGMDPEALRTRYPRTSELPFDSRHKYSAVLNRFAGGPVLTALGAPEVILEASKIEAKLASGMLEKARELASSGFRVLAFGSRPMPSDRPLTHADVRGLTLEGLVVFVDPLRPDIHAVVATAQAAGIRVIMVTGDHAETAQYIARRTGILQGPGRVIAGEDLPEDIGVALDRYDVFARVSPEDKVRIVEAFRSRGHTPAMVGDGVNDAPALLRADIGVAVGSGTDVAKESSDLVLLGDSFRIIVEAVRQGRIIFDNIRKTALFLLSDAFSEIMLICGSILMGLPLPLLPAQILWVNLIEDVLPAIALAWDEPGQDVMRQPPRRITQLFSGNIRTLIAVFTVVTNGVLFALFVWLLGRQAPLEYIRTMIFVGLGITSLAYVYSVRSLGHPIWRTNPLSNPFLNVAVAAGLGLYLLAIYLPPLQRLLSTVPLAAADWTLLAGLAVLNVTLFEIVKWLFIVPDRNDVLKRSAS